MLSSPSDETFFQELDVFNIPIAVIGRIDGQYENIFSLDTDNYQDSFNLCTYLIDQGHKHIACLHSPLDYHVSFDRLQGYKDCLKKNGIPLTKEWIIDCGYTFESAYQAINKYLSVGHLPTAIFATDDLKVMGINRNVQENKLSIPQDLSVIGYCNLAYTPLLSPPLTRVEIPVKILGILATKLLFSKIIQKKEAPLRTLVPTEVILQHSVKKI